MPRRALAARQVIQGLPAWVRAVLYFDIEKLKRNPKLPALPIAIETFRREYDAGRVPSLQLQRHVLKKAYRHFLAKYAKWLSKTHGVPELPGGIPVRQPVAAQPSPEGSPVKLPECAVQEMKYVKYFERWPGNPFIAEVGFAQVAKLAGEL